MTQWRLQQATFPLLVLHQRCAVHLVALWRAPHLALLLARRLYCLLLLEMRQQQQQRRHLLYRRE
jgi:hypothetical protein